MRIKHTDPRVVTDSAALKRMRKKSSIDFLQWTDDEGSAAAPIARVRHGNRSTLQNVNGRALAALPDAVLDRPIAALEFSIDLVAKLATTDEQQVSDLVGVYDVLHRRLAPWRGRFLSTRIARSAERGTSETVVSGRPLVETRADGSVWVSPTAPRWMVPPRAHGRTLLRSHTVYFGHRPVPSWADYPFAPHPEAQVRLYIKVTDAGKPLPRRLWRTRVEVTLNGPPLVEVLGARTVRDLLTSDMRRLVHEYLRLSSPHVDTACTSLNMRRGSMKTLLERRLTAIAARDVASGVSRGNFTVLEDGLVKFRPVGSLDAAILACANDFRRAVRYAKK